MARARKQEIITFKVDDELKERLKGIPNRSEFIRSAVMGALESACPLCGGTGVLTDRQRKHWREFTRTHSLSECSECRALHLVCSLAREG